MEKAGRRCPVTPSPYALTLLERIKKKNLKNIVTVDSMLEGKSYRGSGKIVAAIKELRAEGLCTCETILDSGRFATEITFSGYKQHNKTPGLLRAESEDDETSDETSTEVEPKKERKKYTRRTVRRSAI